MKSCMLFSDLSAFSLLNLYTQAPHAWTILPCPLSESMSRHQVLWSPFPGTLLQLHSLLPDTLQGLLVHMTVLPCHCILL